LPDSVPSLRATQSGKEQGILDILKRIQNWYQVEGLEDEPDLAASDVRQCRKAEGGHIEALQLDCPSTGLVKASDEIQEGRLSASRGSGQRHEFPLVDFQSDFAKGGDVDLAERVRLVDGLQLHEWCVHE
jgi:hypothetical protein